MRDSFVFYRSFFETFKKLPKKERLAIFEAVCDYALNDVFPSGLSGTADAVFTLLKPQVDANLRKYENGLKGGRPSKPNQNLTETKPKPKHNLTITKPKLNDNENDNENDNVNVNENDNENGVGSSSVPDYSSLLLSRMILSYLNETTGSQYEVDEEICDRIGQLVSDGYGEEDFLRVINSKAAEWLNDPKMRRYLRPSTLFGPKFSDYAAAPPALEVMERNQLITDRNGLISERDQLATRYQAIDDRMNELEKVGIDTEQNWDEWKDLDTERSAVGKSIEGLNKRIALLGAC